VLLDPERGVRTTESASADGALPSVEPLSVLLTPAALLDDGSLSDTAELL
jgi:hypothetical protein